jgi:transcriptional regulator with XRE-family HTH domain
MPNRIRQLREMAGMSQCRLARLCGVDRTRLSLAENGHVDLRPDEYEAVEGSLLAAIRERTVALQGVLKQEYSHGG